MKQIFTLLFTLFFMATSYASTKIDDLYYNLDETTGTAEVTYLSELPSENMNYINGAVTIPETVVSGGKTYRVTSIGEDAFSTCYGLSSVSIPSSVTSIGDGAFYGCRELESLVIPDSVTTIGNQAFSFCRVIRSVTLSTSLESMGYQAFAYCYLLTSINIPESLTEIPDQTFYMCSSLPSITIPASVKSIGDSAFQYCPELTKISISASVAAIGYGAFDSCSKMQAIEVAAGNVNYCSVDGVLFSADKTLLLAFPGGLSIDYTIPSSVTEIAIMAFCQNKVLKSVTIPNSVKVIGGWSFMSCEGLKSLIIPESVTEIGEMTFYGCTGMQSIDVVPGNVNYCSVDGVLFSADKTRLVAYPAAVGGHYAIPSTVVEIGDEAFCMAKGLKSVTIPNSVTRIGRDAFRECWGLESIEIPANVTEFGDVAFYQCKSLKSVTFNSKKEFSLLESRLFLECEEIESVRLYSPTPPAASPYLFPYGIYPVAKLYVPGQSLTVYRNTEPWSNFANIIGFYVVDDDDDDDDDPDAVETVTLDSNPVADVYTASCVLVLRNATEQEVRALAPGLYIFGRKKVLVR